MQEALPDVRGKEISFIFGQQVTSKSWQLSANPTAANSNKVFQPDQGPAIDATIYVFDGPLDDVKPTLLDPAIIRNPAELEDFTNVACSSDFFRQLGCQRG